MEQKSNGEQGTRNLVPFSEIYLDSIFGTRGKLGAMTATDF